VISTIVDDNVAVKSVRYNSFLHIYIYMPRPTDLPNSNKTFASNTNDNGEEIVEGFGPFGCISVIVSNSFINAIFLTFPK